MTRPLIKIHPMGPRLHGALSGTIKDHVDGQKDAIGRLPKSCNIICALRQTLRYAVIQERCGLIPRVSFVTEPFFLLVYINTPYSAPGVQTRTLPKTGNRNNTLYRSDVRARTCTARRFSENASKSKVNASVRKLDTKLIFVGRFQR